MISDKTKRQILLREVADKLVDMRVELLFAEEFDSLEDGMESAVFLMTISQMEVLAHQLRVMAYTGGEK